MIRKVRPLALAAFATVALSAAADAAPPAVFWFEADQLGDEIALSALIAPKAAGELCTITFTPCGGDPLPVVTFIAEAGTNTRMTADPGLPGVFTLQVAENVRHVEWVN